MLTYKAMYKFLADGIHGEVLDFPGALTSAQTLTEARKSFKWCFGGYG